jgi:S-adenosylmethionine-diacylglycerol 3-amino-3-carboxypropyl transferase
MKTDTNTEIATKASFDKIRYAQCWEDADILLNGMNIQEGDVCLGIGSAGENCLSMLTRNPSKVIAVDMNSSQLACIELRVAGFKRLKHQELLELIGSRPADNRLDLYERCRPELCSEVQKFWDSHHEDIVNGIGSAGKFERYFATFRNRIIPLIHSQKRVDLLLKGGDMQQCASFYDRKWNNLRWRMLFKVFFSRFMMGRLGRDPAFFNYVKGSVADRILGRTRHALRELNPAENPYLHWILKGTHGKTLPHALRPENFELIKKNIDRLEWRLGTIESVLEQEGENSIDRFNLSDIFEYMSGEMTAEVLERILKSARPGSRLAYWNMLAPRCCPEEWSDRVTNLKDLGSELLLKDKAFFYSAFVVEEVK